MKVTPNLPIETGIKAGRMALRQAAFDKTKSARLVECLKRYRRGINERTNEPVSPVHDRVQSRRRRLALPGDQRREVQQRRRSAQGGRHLASA